jgi:hypothetical protein
MNGNRARFTVDEQGHVTDRESFQGQEKEWSSARTELNDRFMKEYWFKQSKNICRGEGLIVVLGLMSLDASKTTDPWWSFLWGLLAVILFIIGGFLAVAGYIIFIRGSFKND